MEDWKLQTIRASKKRTPCAEVEWFFENISITPERVSTDLDIGEVVLSGEHGFLEFKSSLRWNLNEHKVDKKMEEIILKSISAFSIDLVISAHFEGQKMDT